MKIEVTFDVSAFEKDADVFVERAIGLAIVDALNVAAERARIAVVEAMNAYLDRPTPFTTMGAGAFPRPWRPPGGGTRRLSSGSDPTRPATCSTRSTAGPGPGDPGSTALGPLVPGPDAQLDAFGNLPADFVEEEIAGGAAWVTLTPGEPPAFVRQVAGRMEVLALIVRELHYDTPRLPFYNVVANAVTSAFPAAFDAALAGRLDR